MISTDGALKKYLGFGEKDRLGADEFLEDIGKWCRSRDAISFAILLNGKTAAGIISLSRIHSRAKGARIGYWIGSDYRSNGYCTTAFKLVVDEAACMNLTKVISMIAENNMHSRQIWERIGGYVIGEDKGRLSYELPCRQGLQWLFC